VYTETFSRETEFMLSVDRNFDEFSRAGLDRDEPTVPLTATRPWGIPDARWQADRDLPLRCLHALERIADSLDRVTKAIPLMCPPMTVQDVAAHARVAVKTVYAWKEKGLLRPIADQTTPLLFDRADVEEFLRQPRRGKRCQ
jgi:hypothetical protein